MIATFRLGSPTALERYAILIRGERDQRLLGQVDREHAHRRRCGSTPEGPRTHAVWRERILDNARLKRGETLLDVGCGEGLVAFGGLERGAGRVVLSDISQALLDFCREAATKAGFTDRCRFVRASADQLTEIGNESIDLVTTRSVSRAPPSPYLIAHPLLASRPAKPASGRKPLSAQRRVDWIAAAR
jgi:SAM-dependent methyltransferase